MNAQMTKIAAAASGVLVAGGVALGLVLAGGGTHTPTLPVQTVVNVAATASTTPPAVTKSAVPIKKAVTVTSKPAVKPIQQDDSQTPTDTTTVTDVAPDPGATVGPGGAALPTIPVIPQVTLAPWTPIPPAVSPTISPAS